MSDQSASRAVGEGSRRARSVESRLWASSEPNHRLAVPPGRSSVVHEHDLTYHASLSQLLVRLSRLGKRKCPRDQGLDLLLLEEIEQRNQVLPKPCRFQPLEPLDAVGYHSFAARK